MQYKARLGRAADMGKRHPESLFDEVRYPDCIVETILGDRGAKRGPLTTVISSAGA
ncbi:MAG: hypothetical protein H5T60_11540 [Anaerolineae bacterium]|nr:hypothetical protein [Anaerolineae bacterium]